jgi:HEAT repeat protein
MKEAELIMMAVELYDEAPSLIREWRQCQAIKLNVVKALVSHGSEAIPSLLIAMSGYASEMRKSVALDLGLPHPNLQGPSHVRAAEREVQRRIRDRWQNKCHAPAMALMLIGREAVEPLIREFPNADWLARIEILWTLGSIRDVRAVPLLQSVSKWWNLLDYPEVKRAARAGLSLIREGAKSQGVS